MGSNPEGPGRVGRLARGARDSLADVREIPPAMRARSRRRPTGTEEPSPPPPPPFARPLGDPPPRIRGGTAEAVRTARTPIGRRVAPPSMRRRATLPHRETPGSPLAPRAGLLFVCFFAEHSSRGSSPGSPRAFSRLLPSRAAQPVNGPCVPSDGVVVFFSPVVLSYFTPYSFLRCEGESRGRVSWMGGYSPGGRDPRVCRAAAVPRRGRNGDALG